MSRQEGGTGKKLPPTPSKPSTVVINRKLASLPATPSRQLPKTRMPSEESYYKSDYNEDYNYAYRSQDNLPQDAYTENIYGLQQPQQQQSGQVDHTANKTRYPEINQDNQYSYAPQVNDQYSQSYSKTQNSYDPTIYTQNSYKDEYQQPYVQQNTQVYQGYTDPTYPIASQANDHQYVNQGKNQYDKPDGMITEADFHEMGFDQNAQYQQHYNEQIVYQKQYDDYGVTVPSSVYDQNNVANTYNQYQPKHYDSQYNINTSSDEYQKTYQKTYNQVPVTSQESNYQESYAKQSQEDFANYQTPYSKQEDVPTTYKNNYQKAYQDEDSYDEYQDSYQEAFERYKDSTTTTTTPTTIVDRRPGEVPELSVTTPRGQTRANGYPSNDSTDYISTENEDMSLSTSRRKKLGSKRDASPLLQQNTDSLESRDDELKDSFETAVSSIASSQPKKGYSEYSTAGESSPAPATFVDSPQSLAKSETSTMVNHVPANHVTTTAMVHTTTASIVNGKRPLARTDSYQEDIIEDDEYPEIIPKESQRKDSQMSHQSQLSQHSQPLSQKPKLTRGDSYISDNFPEESYSRRDSYAQLSRKDSFSSSTQEGFKPPLTRTDSYQQRDLRGSNYGQSFTAPQPISRAESYQRGHFKDQESIDQSDIVLGNAVNGDYQMRDETLERYEIMKCRKIN